MARDVWNPNAEVRPLPENSRQSLRSTWNRWPRASIAHTAVDAKGRTNLWGYFARSDVGAESTGWIYRDGHAEQFMSYDVIANANRRADPFAASWETEDDGDPERWEWTDAQLQTLSNIMTWECLTFKIRAVPCAGPYLPEAEGLGYHALWRTRPGGNPWTSYQGKTCPGSKRIHQWWTELLPDVQRRVADGIIVPREKDWFEMATKEELQALLDAQNTATQALLGNVESKFAELIEVARVLSEKSVYMIKGDNRQWLLELTSDGLVKYHVKNMDEKGILARGREVGDELYNLTVLDGDQAKYFMEKIPEVGK